MKLNDLFGNPVEETPKKDYPNIKRTRFREQTAQFMQGIEGAIQPIDIVEFPPNTTIKPSYKIKVMFRNPSIRPLKNSITFHVHTYVAYKRQLDKNYVSYMNSKSGLSNNDTSFKRPLMNFWLGSTNNIDNFDISKPNMDECKDLWTTLTPNSLANCLGIPWEAYTKKVVKDGKTLIANNRYCFRPTPLKIDGATLTTDLQYEISHDLATTDFRIIADPFVMYQKIRRKYYMNYNLATAKSSNNLYWFSEEKNNNNDFRLSASNFREFFSDLCEDGNEVNHCIVSEPIDSLFENEDYRNHALQLKLTSLYGKDGDYINEFYEKKGDNDRKLNDLMTEIPYDNGESCSGYYKKAPYLNSLGFRSVEGDYFTTGSPFPNLMRDGVMPITEHDLNNILEKEDHGVITASSVLNFDEYGKINSSEESIDEETNKTYLRRRPLDVMEKETLKNLIGIDMKDLRTMATLTKFKERLAKINSMDGYNNLIESNFRVNPNIEMNEPIYIGGFSQTLGTYEKQSTNADVNENTPFGTVGTGEMVMSGSCGEFFAKDAGYYMTVISCQISNLYPRHLDRMWTTTEFEEMYFPDFNELEPQATLKREKSLAIASVHRKEPYNYVDRYKHLKTRVSNICGFGQSRKELWDNAQYLQMTEEFETANFGTNAETLHPRYLDNSCLFTTTEPMYDYDILRIMDNIEPLPYKAEPGEILNQ